MNFRHTIFLLTALAFAGCANAPSTARRPAVDRDRVVYTGSNVPRPRNEVTPYPLSANTPPGSVARRAGDLTPTEPVVGATNNTGPGDDTEPLRNTAGPAGSR